MGKADSYPFPPRKGRWVAMGKLNLSDFSRCGPGWPKIGLRGTSEWDKVAAEAARIIGRDSSGNKAFIISSSLCVLTFPRGAARICSPGDTVTLTFPFYRGGVKVVEGMVITPITRKAANEPPLSFLVLVSGRKLEFLPPATWHESVTPPDHFHLLLHCDSGDRLIAQVGFNHSIDYGRMRRNAYTVDRSPSHGDAVIQVEPGRKVVVFGVTYDHGDGAGLHNVDHVSLLSKRTFYGSESFPEAVKKTMRADGWVFEVPFVSYRDGDWVRTKEERPPFKASSVLDNASSSNQT